MSIKENVLVIGNGFDLYHCLPTRYVDFLGVVNRLLELDKEDKLTCCQYIKYLWGPNSPIYHRDNYIKKCYELHSQKMQSVELEYDKLQELVSIAKNNLWIMYFQTCMTEDIGWIDFEKEIGNVLEAVQAMFSMDNMANKLVVGIGFEDMSNIGLKTIDILEHLPFMENTDNTFRIKKEYCKKGIDHEYYVSIDKETVMEELGEHLEQLAIALCIYLKEFVQKIVIDKSSDNPVFYNIDKVLNFNYTDTFRKLYNKDVQIEFIHGSIDDEERGIILGINNDAKDELEGLDSRFIRFKKYYQRAIKDTFYSVEDFLCDEDAEYHVAIVGHSLEITDRDILVGLMNHPRTTVEIYYHDEKAHGQQIINLISLVGKTEFEILRNQRKIVFRKLKEFREAILGGEELDVDYEYQICRNYRLLEDKNNTTNTLLIGNEIVEVSVRDDWVGTNEIKLVDHFLNLQEYYNHSGLYKGIVKLVSLFNDNRYCGAGTVIKYIRVADELDDDMSKIEALFDTECEGIGICISSIEVIDFHNNCMEDI